MSRHVVTPLVGVAAAAILAIGGALGVEGAQLLYLCTNPAGQARLVGNPADCRGNETVVALNVEGQQGSPGPPGPPGAPGPANRVFSGLVSPNGTTPPGTEFTVQHTLSSGTYIISFPKGTFSGSEGKFLFATVTPMGNTYVNFLSFGRIPLDGTGFFEVTFAGGEVLFTFVTAIQD